MTDPNDTLLDEYLTRESAVSQRYRKLEAADVPPELDSAVLAQARAAVSPAQSRASRWRKWTGPIALAASVMLAITIVLEIGLDEEVLLPEVSNEPSSSPTSEDRAVAQLTESVAVSPQFAPPPVEPASHPGLTDATESLMREQLIEEREEQARNAMQRSTQHVESADRMASAPAAAPQGELPGEAPVPAQTERFTSLAAATSAGEVAARDTALPTAESDIQTTRARSSAPVGHTAAQRPASAAPPGVEAAHAPRLAPEDWLKQIRDLRREGKVIEADEQWREFVRAYPNFQVSETDAARPAR